MEILPVKAKGYCLGVVRAIQIAKQTALDYPQKRITVLGMLVHNQYVVDACERLNIHYIEDKTKSRLQLLEEIDTDIVIFTAHGVSDKVKQKADELGLMVIDATCPDVKQTYDLVKNHQNIGDVIYIGKKNHPESEGIISSFHHISFVSCKKDIEQLKDLHNVLITTQTTLSIRDTKELINLCLKRFPDAKVAEEICNATRIRQEAILELENIDTLIIVGDIHSNNTNQLANLGRQNNIEHVYLIDSVLSLKEEMVKNAKRIAISSGSSTPNSLTQQVIHFLEEYAQTNIWKEVKEADIKLL
ncbi:MAG: 4-hydroxy-3-methylbut-2-enyl diphosphate reductase [Solobacterium sp.]|nr:4-hydroxy-3-methylbut-2-enyl diphosphate reductase [Solobacterium sp.]